MDIDRQKLDEFQTRMGNWVASQGLFFQLTHGGGVRGAQSMVLGWCLRMSMRLIILLLVVAFGIWIYLNKRVDFNTFKEELNIRMADALGADEARTGAIQKEDGFLEVSNLELIGGENSFFDDADVRGIRTRMKLLHDVFSTWNGEVVSVDRLDMKIRAGAEQKDDGGNIYNSIFTESDNFKFARVEILDCTLRWGYSAVTEGAIRNAKIRAKRSAEGWEVEVTGGTFSQNWLKELEIVSMGLSVTREGVDFHEVKLASGSGEMNFSAKLEGPVQSPKLTGSGNFRSLPFDSYLNKEVGLFVSGQLSGEFQLSGSPYNSAGVGMTADIKLVDEDEIIIRDKIKFLHAISLVDLQRSYKKVRFGTGRFKMETGQNVAVFRDIWLHSTDLMRLEGSFLAREPSEKEIKVAMALEAGNTVPEPLPEEGSEGVEPAPFDLENAAKSAKESSDSDEKIQTIFETEVFANEVRRREKEAMERFRRIPYLQGLLKFGLHAKALEGSKALGEMFPIEDETGLRWVEVKMDDPLDSAGDKVRTEFHLRVDK